MGKSTSAQSQQVNGNVRPPSPVSSAVGMDLIVVANEEFPRRGEASMVELISGDCLIAYSNHTGRGDNDRGHIAVTRISAEGDPLSEEVEIVASPDDGLNATAPALRRLPDGRLGMLYSDRRAVTESYRRFIWSDDEGFSWSDPVNIDGRDPYVDGVHDRFIILESGRFIAPLVCADNWDRHYTHIRVAFSDDQGATWSVGDKIELPWIGHKYGWEGGWIGSGAGDPAIAERADGSLYMAIRTAMGTQFCSESYDGAETWTSPRSMEVIGLQAPACLMRIPDRADLLLIWTPNYNVRANGGGRRQTLMSALSSSGGRSWPHRRRRLLVRDSERMIDSPSCLFKQGEAWITVRVSEGNSFQDSLVSTGLIRAPIEWFYELPSAPQN
ncbi:MAG: hypothetical protein CMJ49_07470 [Planctomycetaceae bacterium]|nr:hypothetical protein [Planctomycetaceae bacterium]